MRILQFIPSYAPAWQYGGPPRVFHAYGKELVSLGHEVSAYTSIECCQNLSQQEAPQSVDGVSLQYYTSHANILRKIYFNYSPREIAGWLDGNIESFDLVHFGSIRPLPNIVMYAKTRQFKKPYIVSAFGTLPRRNEGLKTIYDRLFVRPLIPILST